MTLSKTHAYTIEYACSEDAPALAALAKYSFEETYLPLAPAQKEEITGYTSKVFALAKVAEELKIASIRYLIIRQWQDGEAMRLLGYAKLNTALPTPSLPDEGTLCIERFYIHPDCKAQKLGTQLMEHILSELAKENWRRVWLCIWDINQAVMQFYQKFGFRHVGHHPFLMGDRIDEDLLMLKEFQ